MNVSEMQNLVNKLFDAMNAELQCEFGLLDSINTNTAERYNFLREVRNDVVKLLVLSLKLNPMDIETDALVSAYLKPDQYQTSAPNDREIVMQYQKEIAERVVEQQVIEFEKSLSILQKKLQKGQSQSSIESCKAYSDALAELQSIHCSSIDAYTVNLLTELECCVNMNGKVMEDKDRNLVPGNPFYILGLGMIREIREVNEDNEHARLFKIYTIFKLALLEIPLCVAEGKQYIDLGLKALIEKQMKEISQKDPTIIQEANEKNADEIKWKLYEIKLRVYLKQLDQQGDRLKGEGMDTQELDTLISTLSESVTAFFKKTSTEKEKAYIQFRDSINSSITKGLQCEIVKNSIQVASIIKNILACLSLFGLYYLHKTKTTRGSFWLHEIPLQTIQSDFEKINIEEKQKNPSS